MIKSPLVWRTTQNCTISRVNKVGVRKRKQFRKVISVFYHQPWNCGLPARQRRVEATSIAGNAGASGIPPSEAIQLRTHLPHNFVDGETLQRRGLFRPIRFLFASPGYAISLTDLCVVPRSHTFFFTQNKRCTWKFIPLSRGLLHQLFKWANDVLPNHPWMLQD